MGPQDFPVILGRHESVCLSSNNASRTLHLCKNLRALNDWTRRQPILADEIQTFKALITIHKVLQEGHPIVLKEAQQNVNWVESLARGVNGEGLRGMVWQCLVIWKRDGTVLQDCKSLDLGCRCAPLILP